jgi:hypothetical protein
MSCLNAVLMRLLTSPPWVSSANAALAKCIIVGASGLPQPDMAGNGNWSQPRNCFSSPIPKPQLPVIA